jgi:hypothetical protein
MRKDEFPLIDAYVDSKVNEVLNKIKAEIEALPKTYPFVNHIDMYVKVSDVTKIIEKYKAGSEQ